MNDNDVHVRQVGNEPGLLAGLAEVLMDCVEGGASVSFMWPLAREDAIAFWREAMAEAASGKRILLVAEDHAGQLVGTVQVLMNLPENQPHRGDLVKMLVHRSSRRKGVGAALVQAAERAAWGYRSHAAGP